MPMPRAIPRSRFVRQVFNPAIARLAGNVPPLSLLHHRGRTSGRHHHTPVLAFRRSGGFAIAMVYGRGTDWERNLEAAGGGQLDYRGASYAVTNPRTAVGQEAMDALPGWTRPIWRVIRVDAAVLLDEG